MDTGDKNILIEKMKSENSSSDLEIQVKTVETSDGKGLCNLVQEDPTFHDVEDSEGNVHNQSDTNGQKQKHYPMLKEFAPMVKLFSLLPSQAQRGLRTVDISLTCVDAVSEYLVIGSSIGIIYLYQKKQHNLQRLRCKGYNGPITRVCIISSVSFMVAAGTEKGSVFVFEVPKLQLNNKPLTFSVQDIHQHCITALCWSVNAMKLFSGDSSGLVACTEIDYVNQRKTSKPVIQEKYEVTQIEYVPKHLLISTLHRTIICSIPSIELLQVGKKERKYLGRFGACYYQHKNFSEVFATRPGLHLCRARLDGTISETLIFKEAIRNRDRIELLRAYDVQQNISDLQFGPVKIYLDELLVTWYDNSLFIIDPELRIVVTSCEGLYSLRDVAISDDEIFLLCGIKHIIRIATTPEVDDDLGIQEQSIIEDLVSPLKEFSLKLKERSSSIFRNSSFSEVRNLDASNGNCQENKDVNCDASMGQVIPRTGSFQSHVNFDICDGAVIKKTNDLTCINKARETAPDPKILQGSETYDDLKEQNNLSFLKQNIFQTSVIGDAPDSLLQPAIEAKELTCENSESNILEKKLQDEISRELKMNNKSDFSVDNEKTTDEIVFKPRKKRKGKKSGVLTNIPKGDSSVTLTTSSTDMHLKKESFEECDRIKFDIKDNTLNFTDSGMEDAVDNISLSSEKSQNSKEEVCHKENDTSPIKPVLIPDAQIEAQLMRQQDALLDSILSNFGKVKDTAGTKGETNLSEATKTDHMKERNDLNSDSMDEVPPLCKENSENSESIENKETGEKCGTVHLDGDLYKKKDRIRKREAHIQDLNEYSDELAFNTQFDRSSQADGGISLTGTGASFSSDHIGVQTEVKQIVDFPDDTDVSLDLSDKLKYGVDWVQHKVPGPIVCLATSNTSLFCVDNSDTLYRASFTGLVLSWKSLNQPAVQVAVSPSGNILWTLYNDTIYAAVLHQKDQYYLSSVEWTVADKGIIYITVDDNSAWYITCNGDMFTQSCLTPSRPVNDPIHVPAPWTFQQVSCYNGAVWALTTEKKIVYRLGIHARMLQGSSWRVLDLGISSPEYIALGSQEVAWIVDSDGIVSFRTGISNITPEGSDETLWQVEMSDYVYQQINQVKKAVMKTLNPEKLSNLFLGPQQTIVVSNEKGVWYCKKQWSIIYSNQKAVIGHSWNEIIPKGMSQSSKWLCVNSAGVRKNKGLVWVLSKNQELFCFSPTKLRPLVVPLPYTAPVCCLAAAPQALWFLNTRGHIFCREGISSQNPEGTRWHQLNLSQLEGVHLTHISCSEDMVWACDTNGAVYMRIGSLNPEGASSLAQVWIPLDEQTSAFDFKKLSSFRKHFALPSVAKAECRPPQLIKICTGPKSFMVWAIDDKRNVYVREGVSLEMPLGENWAHVPGLHAEDICCSENAVWVLKPSGKIYRRFGITEANYMGDYWKQIPAKLNYLSVTSDDDLWGLRDNTLFQHSSFRLFHHDSSAEAIPLEQEEKCKDMDDWEIL